ncbi:MAG: hypothetical protein A3E36_03070 [Candidatus Andersenbacteria bacterium RIFCSPHIGHO2_12_FULL_45_11b]|uniref:Glycerophosphoryl diester phosphodiesterase membrane domain-containing protein n=1 Tax=Candidatus Andersenbacteria bacterium RIFCSPHIGHO2_12_FULL_45_11b TaxID=1797282 RepID=A0A1G1XBD9_9BACT|nr:MAG: hypothetical protein A3E36_03070 [Candidatus Andersenbacteria bacterium RIFCSPHIGHO2_12_FULL_45_11b]
MTTPFPTFIDQLSRAWKLFLSRWGTAVVLELLIIIPALLTIPLMVQYLSALSQGVDVFTVVEQSPYTGQFLIGFFTAIFFGILSMTAMMLLFTAEKKISLFVALTGAVKVYIPVLYTSFLAALLVAISFLPSEVLNFWYLSVRNTFPLSEGGLAALDIVEFVAFVALMIPAFIVTIWVMYAPLAVALKETSGGVRALLFSKEVVRKHVWGVAWRMLGALVLFQVVSISVSQLPIAGVIVPFVLMILTIAFFVELYKELRAR